MTQMIHVTVNGSACEAEVEPRMLLVDFLREAMGLTGTHVGCDTSQCGACTVHIDGVATRSCVTQIGDIAGKSITTIEGLDSDEGKALQQAWVNEQVPQCGYCQSGQIMQAAGFLANTPDPSDEQITEAMNGNLCRCMAYTRIHKAIKSAAGGEEA